MLVVERTNPPFDFAVFLKADFESGTRSPPFAPFALKRLTFPATMFLKNPEFAYGTRIKLLFNQLFKFDAAASGSLRHRWNILVVVWASKSAT
jgi:hypothetical protein